MSSASDSFNFNNEITLDHPRAICQTRFINWVPTYKHECTRELYKVWSEKVFSEYPVCTMYIHSHIEWSCRQQCC